MKLLATVLTPEHPDEAARAVASAAGLALAEARMRLAREPPALLALLEAERADAVASSLRQSGLAALAVDTHVPSDKDRTVARVVAFADSGVTFTPSSGEAMEVAWSGVMAILHGARELRSDIERTERVPVPSIGAAVATHGAWMTRTSERSVRSSDSWDEQVILVYVHDGRTAMIVDNQFDFTSLRPSLLPSSTANMIELARRLREKAPGAFYDERLLRLGRRQLPFVADTAWRSRTTRMSVSRSDSRASFDVLAEVMHQALVMGLLR